MRTKEFKFKKTVKKTKSFNAISVDLTVDDALYVLQTLLAGSSPLEDGDCDQYDGGQPDMLSDLIDSLRSFLDKHDRDHY